MAQDSHSSLSQNCEIIETRGKEQEVHEKHVQDEKEGNQDRCACLEMFATDILPCHPWHINLEVA